MCFYMKTYKKEALLMKNLQRELFFASRNPFSSRRPNWHQHAPILFYLLEPLSASCWGTNESFCNACPYKNIYKPMFETRKKCMPMLKA